MMSPRAADDFTTIRARLRELRGDRPRLLSETESGSEFAVKPDQGARTGEIQPEGHRLSHPVRQRLFE